MKEFNITDEMDVIAAVRLLGGLSYLLERKELSDGALVGDVQEISTPVLGGKLTVKWEYTPEKIRGEGNVPL